LTEDYNLELQYRKPFLEVWRDEKDDSELGPLSERMGVRDRATGELLMTDEEKEAASKYLLFPLTILGAALIGQVSTMHSASIKSRRLCVGYIPPLFHSHLPIICIIHHLYLSNITTKETTGHDL
jgi:hypothetical protein